jgi:fluoride exporter
MNALSLAYVAVGGAFGSMLRYFVQTLFKGFLTSNFPVGTFVVNILGGFLLGVWIAIIVYFLPTRSRELHLLVAVGGLGGFTTFSTFTMESYLLLEKGLWTQGALYIVGSVLLSLLAFFGGMWLMKSVFG